MQALDRSKILRWLREEDEQALELLYAQADEVRRNNVGDAVHLRGLIEISSHCVRHCLYCGLRFSHRMERYRMSREEILKCANNAATLGFGTIVMQSGEDYGIHAEWMSDLIREIKATLPLAITLSLGERDPHELEMWKQAGADRYLMRFETSDPALYAAIHPPLTNHSSDRIAQLRTLREMGYEIGSGIMVGIPGQSFDILARDIETFAELDLDMIGIGPFLPHPATPLGSDKPLFSIEDQVPGSEQMVLKAVALTRIVCPQANLPSTTALATMNPVNGREHGLQSGANVFMPNLTPSPYRRMYEIYPDKACVDEDAQQCDTCLRGRIRRLGRVPGAGPGGRGAEPVYFKKQNPDAKFLTQGKEKLVVLA
jgi:biotin synthase